MYSTSSAEHPAAERVSTHALLHLYRPTLFKLIHRDLERDLSTILYQLAWPPVHVVVYLGIHLCTVHTEANTVLTACLKK